MERLSGGEDRSCGAEASLGVTGRKCLSHLLWCPPRFDNLRERRSHREFGRRERQRPLWGWRCRRSPNRRARNRIRDIGGRSTAWISVIYHGEKSWRKAFPLR